jgi:penicillin amidase
VSAALVLLGLLAGHGALKAQGLATDRDLVLDRGRAAFDEMAIPTVEAGSWRDAFEVQGFVTAGERLWQMDLMRRAARGRLSEWFGADALSSDRVRREEGWPAHIRQEYARLPADEREACEAYAAGVNRFIAGHRLRWGAEYLLLRTEPAPWLGEDCLAATAILVQDLGERAVDELSASALRSKLSPSWERLLFPTRDATMPRQATEPLEPCLPMSELGPLDVERGGRPPQAHGSNAWVAQKGESRLLASDPHLGHTVPQLFYATRFSVGNARVAGAAMPGIPGVVIGMNDSLAWSFTSLEEDNDDYLEVVVDEPTQTLRFLDQPSAPGVPFERAVDTIEVRGSATESVERRFTAHGPVLQRDGRWFLRHWMALEEGSLRVPSVALERARDEVELRAAFDRFRLPTFHAVFAVRGRGIGYRVVGDAWPSHFAAVRKLEPAFLDHPRAPRPRETWLPASSAFEGIASANEAPFEEWASGHPHDDGSRARRLRDLLSREADQALTVPRMSSLQLDTFSEFHSMLVRWVLDHAKTDSVDRALLERWRAWTGVATEDPRTFTEATRIEKAMRGAFLRRIGQGFRIAAEDDYSWIQSRVWLRDTLNEPGVLTCMGIDPGELASRALALAAALPPSPDYTADNVPEAQHPLTAAPLLGRLFEVTWAPQRGYAGLVRFESPGTGPAFRAVFDVEHPSSSAWSFPMGQSGHARSAHFSSFRSVWGTPSGRPVWPSSLPGPSDAR